MKNLLVSLLTIGYFLTTNAQEKLVVEYESRMILDVEELMSNVSTSSSTKIDNKELEKALMESLMKPSYYKLTLGTNESVFNLEEKLQNDQPKENGMSVVISYGGSRGTLYKNIGNNQSLKTENTFGKNYLISNELTKYDWKISKESKEILGYEVRKAEAKMDSTTNVIAWYAPKLPYKNGPSSYQGLPGLILELEEINTYDGSMEKLVYTAQNIQVDKDQKPIIAPTKGEKITQSDFEDMMKKQSQKMMEMYQGGVDKE
jgi:GLPGLI family protein